MYREVIEHPWSIPDEIKRHINLHSGEDRGRVYRIAPKQGAKRIGEKVELATADTTTLIATLGHANGWHRETAHRLLIERHPKDALPGLGELLVHGTDVAKLHALGVLEELHALSAKQITGALDDKHWAVRERALRLAGQHAANQTLHSSEERAQLAKKIATLADDKVTRVRFELALTLAALLEKRQDSELDVALLKLAEHDYANPWIAPALLSAPPEQIVRTLFDPIKKQTRSSSDRSLLAFQAQLTEMKAAIVPEETRVALIRELTEGAPNTALLRALGDGLKRAGTTLEKADIEKRLGPIFTQAIADLQSNSASESASISAIELLKLAPAATALPAIETCLRESAPASVQSAAINAVAKILPNSAAQRLLSHWKKLHPAAQSAAVAALTDRDNNTLALLNAIKENTVSAQSLSSTQIQGILKSKNAEITNLAKTALAAVLPQSRAEAVTKYAGSLAAKGDAHNGKSQFMQRCQVCHQAAGAGIQVGPDLVTVKTKGRDALLSAILEPNKEVATAYIVYQVETKEGQTLQGFISEDNADALTLKMAGGVTQTIKRSQIKGTSSGGQSLMPEGIETGMSVQEMADLLTFIETLP
jgi:putative heme-binding domain-containing protein